MWKFREQTDRERREAQIRTEQLQNEIERLKNELTHKKEMIFEKDKLIQDAQYKSREILLERQSVEDRISNEYRRLNELVEKYVPQGIIILVHFLLASLF